MAGTGNNSVTARFSNIELHHMGKAIIVLLIFSIIYTTASIQSMIVLCFKLIFTNIPHKWKALCFGFKKSILQKFYFTIMFLESKFETLIEFRSPDLWGLYHRLRWLRKNCVHFPSLHPISQKHAFSFEPKMTEFPICLRNLKKLLCEL